MSPGTFRFQPNVMIELERTRAKYNVNSERLLSRLVSSDFFEQMADKRVRNFKDKPYLDKPKHFMFVGGYPNFRQIHHFPVLP